MAEDLDIVHRAHRAWVAVEVSVRWSVCVRLAVLLLTSSAMRFTRPASLVAERRFVTCAVVCASRMLVWSEWRS